MDTMLMSLLLLCPKPTTMLCLFVIFLSYRLCQSRRTKTYSEVRQLPEAAGAWPIIGHLHLFSGPELPHEMLSRVANNHGPIFRIRLGVQPVVVISSGDLAKECFTKNDVAVSSRPKQVSGEHLGYNFSNFTFAPYGPYWHEMRKISRVHILSNSCLEKFNKIRESEMATSLRDLYNVWINRHDVSNKDRVTMEMRQWFEDLALNVILQMVVRKRYSIASDTNDKEKARRAQKVIRRWFHFAGIPHFADAFPYLRWLDLDGHVKVMKETAEEFESLFEDWFKENLEKRTAIDQGADDAEHNFFNVLLSILDEQKIVDFDAGTIIKATVTSLVAGGGHTTAITSTWGLSLLLNNPKVLRKLQDELDARIGRERFVRETDIGNLVYLQAIIKETFRLYPPGPIPGAREFIQDCTIGGYHIPKGTQLMVNVHKIQRNPEVWEDPNEFRPERFLTTNHKDIDVKGKHFDFLPFGGGRRACPGMGHGIRMAHFTMASLVHAFDMVNVSGAPIDMKGTVGLTNAKATPLLASIKPRLSPSAYA